MAIVTYVVNNGLCLVQDLHSSLYTTIALALKVVYSMPELMRAAISPRVAPAIMKLGFEVGQQLLQSRDKNK